MDDVGAPLPGLDELGNDLRRILKVAVHVDDRVALGMAQAGQYTGSDTEPAGHIHNFDARIPLALGVEGVEGVVRRIVIDEDELVVHARCGHDDLDPADELGEDLGLVPEGEHDRQQRHRPPKRAIAKDSAQSTDRRTYSPQTKWTLLPPSPNADR